MPAGAGFELVVFDVRPEAVQALVDAGASAATSPADLLDRCDVAVSMVFGPREVEQVVRGDGGLLSTDCTGKHWVDLTTSSPVLMRELAAESTAAGGAAVDAPVTGSVDAAIRGDMPLFVGGEDAAVGEAMVTAKLAGLEPEVWWEVMKGGAADSFVLQHDVPSIFAGHYDKVIEDDAGIDLRVDGDWLPPWQVTHPDEV